jgi:pSer/pThr/pTyr-binding forkhead associated (FHA) protein
MSRESTPLREITPYLRQTAGPGGERVVALPLGEHVIGREAGATLLLDHPDISRRHALLRVSDDGIEVEDLGSKNGVMIDGERVVGRRVLTHGSVFQVGGAIFEAYHPGAQVLQALRRAGESTVTRGADQAASAAEASLRLPLLATALLLGVVIALLWRGL